MKETDNSLNATQIKLSKLVNRGFFGKSNQSYFEVSKQADGFEIKKVYQSQSPLGHYKITEKTEQISEQKAKNILKMD